MFIMLYYSLNGSVIEQEEWQTVQKGAYILGVLLVVLEWTRTPDTNSFVTVHGRQTQK